MLVWSGSLGFALLALRNSELNIANFAFFMTGLRLSFMTRIYSPEWQPLVVDLWITSSFLITALPVSSVSGFVLTHSHRWLKFECHY